MGFAMLLFALFIVAALGHAPGSRPTSARHRALRSAARYVAVSLLHQVQSASASGSTRGPHRHWRDSNNSPTGWFSLAAGGVTGTGSRPRPVGHVPVHHLGHDLRGGRRGAGLPRRLHRAVPVRALRRRGLPHRPARALGLRAPVRDRPLTATSGFQAFFIMAGVLRILPFTGHHAALHGLRRQLAARQLPHRGAAAAHLDENATELRGGEIRRRPARPRGRAPRGSPRRTGSAPAPAGAAPG